MFWLRIDIQVSHLMQALTDQQQFGKADEMYDKCIELEPDNATTYVHKGYVLSLRSFWSRAVGIFKWIKMN